jgi:hypothetical protein
MASRTDRGEDSWSDQGRVLDQEGLLQGVLAGKNRVRNHVGVDHPAGTRRELQGFLAAVCLERWFSFRKLWKRIMKSS